MQSLQLFLSIQQSWHHKSKGGVDENGTGPIEASISPPSPWGLAEQTLDRLTSRPVAQQLFPPSVNWQPGLLLWGWKSLSRLLFSSLPPSLTSQHYFPSCPASFFSYCCSLCQKIHLLASSLLCPACLTLPLQKSDMTFIYRSNKQNMTKKLLEL